MAIEFNDLKGLLFVVVIAIPLASSMNIDCRGKPFYCLNATHFMICVDLGGGVSTTIDDFIIPCPPTTECNESNRFECEFPKIEVTSPPLSVIGVSEAAESLVTNVEIALPVELTTILPAKENNTVTASPLLVEESTTPSNIEILERLNEVFTRSDEPLLVTTTIQPLIIENSSYINKTFVTTKADEIVNITNNNLYLETTTETLTDNTTKDFALVDPSQILKPITIGEELFNENTKDIVIKNDILNVTSINNDSIIIHYDTEKAVVNQTKTSNQTSDTPKNSLSDKNLTTLSLDLNNISYDLTKLPDNILLENQTHNSPYNVTTPSFVSVTTSKIVTDTTATTERALETSTTYIDRSNIDYVIITNTNNPGNDNISAVRNANITSIHTPTAGNEMNTQLFSDDTTTTTQSLEITTIHFPKNLSNDPTLDEANYTATISPIVFDTSGNGNSQKNHEIIINKTFTTNNTSNQVTESLVPISAQNNELASEKSSLEQTSTPRDDKGLITKRYPSQIYVNDTIANGINSTTNEMIPLLNITKLVNETKDDSVQYGVSTNLPIEIISESVINDTKHIIAVSVIEVTTVSNLDKITNIVDNQIGKNESYAQKQNNNVTTLQSTALNFEQTAEMPSIAITYDMTTVPTDLTSIVTIVNDAETVLNLQDEISTPNVSSTDLNLNVTMGSKESGSAHSFVPNNIKAFYEVLSAIGVTDIAVNDSKSNQNLTTTEANTESIDIEVVNTKITQEVNNIHQIVTDVTSTSMSPFDITTSNSNANKLEEFIVKNYSSISTVKNVNTIATTEKMEIIVNQTVNPTIVTTKVDTNCSTPQQYDNNDGDVGKSGGALVFKNKTSITLPSITKAMETTSTRVASTTPEPNITEKIEVITVKLPETKKNLNNVNKTENERKVTPNLISTKQGNIPLVEIMNKFNFTINQSMNVTLIEDKNQNTTSDNGLHWEPNGTFYDEIITQAANNDSNIVLNSRMDVDLTLNTNVSINKQPEIQNVTYNLKTIDHLTGQKVNKDKLFNLTVETVTTEPLPSQNIKTSSSPLSFINSKSERSSLNLPEINATDFRTDYILTPEKVNYLYTENVTAYEMDSESPLILKSNISHDVSISKSNSSTNGSRVNYLIVNNGSITISLTENQESATFDGRTLIPITGSNTTENKFSTKQNADLNTFSVTTSITTERTDVKDFVTTQISTNIYKNGYIFGNTPVITLNKIVTEPTSVVETIDVNGNKTLVNPVLSDMTFSENVFDTYNQIYNTKSKANRENVNLETVNETETIIQMNADIEKGNEDAGEKYDTSITNFEIASHIGMTSPDLPVRTENIDSASNIGITGNSSTVNLQLPGKSLLESIKTASEGNNSKHIYSSGNSNPSMFDIDNEKPNASQTNLAINKLRNSLTQHQNTSLNKLQQQANSSNDTITSELPVHNINISDTQTTQTNNESEVTFSTVNNSKTSTNVNINSNVNNVTSTFECQNKTRGKHADVKDCRKFYFCLGRLEPVLGICPNNTVFSEINKQCTRNLSHCIRNNQFHCLYEGRFTDFFKDNIYYICVKNNLHGFLRYKLQCQDGYRLNKATIKCEQYVDISIQFVSSVSESSKNTNDQIGLPVRSNESEKSTDDVECKKEGKFPYLKDCRKYYVCSKIGKELYRRKIKKCSSDEYFDKEKKKCVSLDSNDC